jgi:WD40 repeat protein
MADRLKMMRARLAKELPMRHAGFARLLFGRDFFISYSRRDAAAYAATLASRLSAHYSCYLDQLALPRGAELPSPIRREVRRATVLVLVGSPGAVDSIYVRDELQLFLGTGRPLLLIDIDGGLERVPRDSPPWSNLVGVYRQRESYEALQRAEPSASVLAYLRDSFTFTRQDRRLRVASAAAALLLLVVLIVASVVSAVTTRTAADAARRADEAHAQEAVARASATEHQRIAASRRLAGESLEQLRERPDLGLLLAANAHQTHPSVEAYRSLFSGLMRYPGLSRVIRDSRTPEAMSMTASADGRFFATGDNSLITIWDSTTVQPRKRIEEADENFTGFALSPDGSVLAAGRSKHVTLVDASTGRELGRIADVSTSTLSFVDGRFLALGSGNAVEIWDVSTPARPVSKSVLVFDDAVQALAVHPSGPHLVVATFKQIFVCAPFSRNTTRYAMTDSGDFGFTVLAVPADPDTPLLAAVNVAGRIVVWNLSTRERIASLSLVGALDVHVPGSGTGRDIFTVAFSPDGERLAAGSLRGWLAIARVEDLARWSQFQQQGKKNLAVSDAEMAFLGTNGVSNLFDMR